MKSPYQYLIKPDGDRYNNAKLIEGDELIVNTTNDETDFKYTNRIGEVVGLPVRNHAELQVGDKVIVHHNTFRKWWNVRGLLKDSSNFIRKDLFQANTDMIYAYNRGDGWKTTEKWVFVKPIELKKELLEQKEGLEVQKGIVKWGSEHEGKEVYFSEHAEYAFNIDGELLYRMHEEDLRILL